MGGQIWNSNWKGLQRPLGFFNAKLECSREGENDDQGAEERDVMQSPGEGRVGERV